MNKSIYVELEAPIWLELPYDRGFPHQLKTATAAAVISADLATWLQDCGMQFAWGGVPDRPAKGPIAWERMSIADTHVTFDGSCRVKVSKKAAGLLREARPK